MVQLLKIKKKKNCRNAVNICRASKNVFDKYINFRGPDAKKDDQSGKNSAANDLRIFEDINKEKLSEKELRSVISSLLDFCYQINMATSFVLFKKMYYLI